MISTNYEYFLRIVRMRSISKAAESLFITQPSLTKYLQRLEADVGAELFDRKKTPLQLTDSGQLFYQYVLKIMEEENTLRAQIQEVKSEERATIKLGIPLWRASTLLPEFLPGFLERHPLIRIELTEGRATELEGAIAREEIDFGLMNLPVNYANVFYETIAEEHIFLVASKQNAFAQEYLKKNPMNGGLPQADIMDFANQPFVLTQPGQHITDYVNNLLSKINLELNCVIRTKNVSTAINLAAANIGFTFVPELGTKSNWFPLKDVILFSVNVPPLMCSFAAVYKKNKYLSRAERLFISELQEYAVPDKALFF